MQGNLLILRRRVFAEGHLLLWALDAKGTAVTLKAMGAKKSRKRFGAGALEPTHCVAAVWSLPQKKPHSEAWPFLREARVVRDFSALRSCYDRLSLGLYFVNTVYKVFGVHGGCGGVELYRLLGNALHEAQTSSNLELLRLQFELKFLFQNGVLSISSAVRPYLEQPLRMHAGLKFSGQLLDQKNHGFAQLER